MINSVANYVYKISRNIIILVIFAGLFYYAFVYGEIDLNYYISYTEAERDGSVARGWIPTFVPRNAKYIHEVHDLDSNRQWLSFEILRSNAKILTDNVQPISSDKITEFDEPPRWEGIWQQKMAINKGKNFVKFYKYKNSKPRLYDYCISVCDFDELNFIVYVWSC